MPRGDSRARASEYATPPLAGASILPKRNVRCNEFFEFSIVSEYSIDKPSLMGYASFMSLFPEFLLVTKKCHRCQEVKNVSKFHRRSKSADGLSSSCKKCMSAKNVSAQRKRRDDGSHYLSVYGAALDYSKLLSLQGGGCAICGKSEHLAQGRKIRPIKKLAVDHDHVTGKIRGLLCRKCNWGLGYFGDNASIIRKAAAYLESSQNVEIPTKTLIRDVSTDRRFKIEKERIQEIKLAVDGGMLATEASEKFGVSGASVSRIRNGQLRVN